MVERAIFFFTAIGYIGMSVTFFCLGILSIGAVIVCVRDSFKGRRND